MPNELNLTRELARLLEYTAQVAIAIRMNTPYNGEFDPCNPQYGYDAMWLADSLHGFMNLAEAIKHDDADEIVFACDMLAEVYASYTEDPGEARVKGDPPGAFKRHAEYFRLEDGRAIFADIKAKAQLVASNCTAPV